MFVFDKREFGLEGGKTSMAMAVVARGDFRGHVGTAQRNRLAVVVSR